MNQRERLLLMIIGAVGLLVGLWFIGYSWLWVGKFQTRYTQINDLQDKLAAQKKVLDRAPAATKKMNAYEERALSPELSQARSAYMEFLVESAKRKAGLREVNVNPLSNNAKKGQEGRLAFSLQAEGNLEQVTKFLHLFYSVDYLQRIQTVRLQPLDRSKDLRMMVTIEALSLPGAAKRSKLTSGPADRLALKSEAEYLKTILNRNVFGPPNQSPKIASVSTQQATVKKPLTVAIKVTEPDWLDILKCELESPSAVSGATLKPVDPAKPGEAPTMQFAWTPPAKGEYTFTVKVIDDGLPSKEDKKTFKVVVNDPPKPPPSGPKPSPKPTFDVAKFTFLTSILVRDGEPGIWLIERTTGKRIELGEGDSFEVGSVKGVVTKIGVQEVEIEVEGKRRVLPLGSSLVESLPPDL